MDGGPKASSKKAVRVIFGDEAPNGRRRRRPVWIVLGAAALLVAAIAATTACLLLLAFGQPALEEVPPEKDREDEVVFRLNVSESGRPERIVLRPRELTAELQTDTMDVLQHFSKNVTWLRVKDDFQTPPAGSFGTAAAALGSLCLLSPLEPDDLRPREMMRLLDEGRPLSKPDKTVYYDLAILTDDELKDMPIDDQMIRFCGNSSVFTLKHAFDVTRKAELQENAGSRRKRTLGDESDPFRLRLQSGTGPDQASMPHCRPGAADLLPADGGNAGRATQQCCHARQYSCPPKVRHHCYVKLMNGQCDRLSCPEAAVFTDSLCSCPVKSILICVRLRGGPWSKEMCCDGDQPCTRRCFPDDRESTAATSTTTTTTTVSADLDVIPLPPPKIQVKVFPPPLPRKTLAELLARRTSVLSVSYNVIP